MKIGVCVKLVPSTTAVIRISGDGKSLDLAGVEMVMSPYDEFAIEEALKAREKIAGSEVLVLTAGPDGAAKLLETAFALGVDRCVHIKAENLDAAAAARCAAKVLKEFGAELVFCGRQAIDDDQWLFPAALGETMDMPHVSAAASFELAADGKQATCKRRVEGGEQVIELKLPAVVSCEKGLNEPRSPTLKGRLAAKKKPVETKTPAELGVDAAGLASALQVTGFAPPPSKSPGKAIKAPPAEAAAELVRLLHEEAKVI